jgi:uncharacterized membrane protein YeaQ/YmgE (transglycosylase-associated protein family)
MCDGTKGVGISIFAWIAVGIVTGLIRNIAERRRGLLIDLIASVSGALAGGFLCGHFLSFSYAEGPTLLSVAAAATGALAFAALSRTCEADNT